jgi:hypothetical protein
MCILIIVVEGAGRLFGVSWMSDMGPILSSGQGEAAATTVVAAAASVTG